MNSNTNKDRPMLTREQIALFDKVRMQLKQLVQDTESLSKKAPNDLLNEFKSTLINEQLRKANTLLKA